MEMFGGALTGSGVSGASSDKEARPFANGMLSIYMHVEHFHADDWFNNEVRSYIDFYKSAEPAQAGGEVLIPGEKEQQTMAERLTSGLPLARQTWEDITGKAAVIGLSAAQIDGHLA